jgi:MFS transporter, UMF1 family
MLAKMLRNDFYAAFTTISSTAVLFAKTTLHLPASVLILVGVLTPSAGILGALVWPIVQRRLKFSNLQVG